MTCRETEIRLAEYGDMDEITRVIREAQAFMRTLDIDQWKGGYPERETLEQDTNLSQLYVGADEKAVHGVAALQLLPEAVCAGIDGQWRRDGLYLTIHRKGLGSGQPGRGKAGRLLGKTMDIARENGCASVRSDTHPGNRAMRRFLEKRL